jgi:hypothetical protein
MKKALAKTCVDLKNRPRTPLPCQHLLLFLATTFLTTQELQRCYLNVPDEEGEYCRTATGCLSCLHLHHVYIVSLTSWINQTHESVRQILSRKCVFLTLPYLERPQICDIHCSTSNIIHIVLVLIYMALGHEQDIHGNWRSR